MGDDKHVGMPGSRPDFCVSTGITSKKGFALKSFLRGRLKEIELPSDHLKDGFQVSDAYAWHCTPHITCRDSGFNADKLIVQDTCFFFRMCGINTSLEPKKERFDISSRYLDV